MAKYRVLTRSFIDNHLREEGDVVEYDGIPGPNLEPMDKAATKATAAAVDADAESAERQKMAVAGVESLPAVEPAAVN